MLTGRQLNQVDLNWNSLKYEVDYLATSEFDCCIDNIHPVVEFKLDTMEGKSISLSPVLLGEVSKHFIENVFVEHPTGVELSYKMRCPICQDFLEF